MYGLKPAGTRRDGACLSVAEAAASLKHHVTAGTFPTFMDFPGKLSG